MKLKGLLLVLLLVFSLAACGEDGVEYPQDYFNATITESSTSGDAVTFTVESTGFYDMVVEVTITNGEITAYSVKEHTESETYGGILISEGDFIADLIDANGDLSNSELDAYAGATATRDALVDVAKAALDHYNAYYA